MRERIEQLWKQAGGEFDTGNQWTYPEYKIDNPENFAELVIKECLWQVVKDNQIPQDVQVLIGERIAEQFGVK